MVSEAAGLRLDGPMGRRLGRGGRGPRCGDGRDCRDCKECGDCRDCGAWTGQWVSAEDAMEWKIAAPEYIRVDSAREIVSGAGSTGSQLCPMVDTRIG